jgi:hypothetical protein
MTQFLVRADKVIEVPAFLSDIDFREECLLIKDKQSSMLQCGNLRFWVFLEGPYGFPAVHDRHFEVHQNYVRALGHGQLAALLAVVSRENLEIAASFKARLQHVEVIVIVFDVEHFGGQRCRFPSFLTALLVTFCSSHFSDHSLGRRTVNTEPLPGSLSTVMSPPIIWQKRLLIARPRPVPPYLRVVEALGLGKFLEQLAHLLRRHANALKTHDWNCCRTTQAGFTGCARTMVCPR